MLHVFLLKAPCFILERKMGALFLSCALVGEEICRCGMSGRIILYKNICEIADLVAPNMIFYDILNLTISI